MPSPQKAKGSSWERDVAKFLTTLYGETFIRAPGSGAYVGGVNTKRKEAGCDTCPRIHQKVGRQRGLPGSRP